MIPLAVLEQHLAHLSREKVEVILEIRNIVAGLCPDAVERLDRKGITYYDARRGGPVRAGICQVLFEEKSLRLAFIHGACLPDSSRLLQGETYPKRFMVLGDYEAIPWGAVSALIKASANFDPLSLPENQKKTASG